MRLEKIVLILVVIAVVILVASLAGDLAKGFFGQINQALILAK